MPENNVDKTEDQKKAGDGAPPKVEFTPEQQAQIQVLIDGAYAKAFAKANEKYRAEADILKAQIQTLNESKGKDHGKGEDLTALKEGLAAITQELKQAKETAARDNLKAIAAELNAVNGEQVAMLVSPYIQMVDGKIVVLNAEGIVRINGKGDPMTTKELVTEFLAHNLHLFKAGGSAGAGSTGARGGNGVSKTVKRGDYEQMTPQGKSDFIKSGGIPID